MNELLKEGLFGLLSESSQQVTNEEMQSAYGNFMEQLRTVSQSGTDYSEVFRILNTTRIELDSLGTLPLYGQGEKCPEICLFRKGIGACQL